jgi:hypothetical protein
MVFEEEGPPPAEASRCLAIARVSRVFNLLAIQRYQGGMGSSLEVKIGLWKAICTLVQFSCLGDWEKVMQGGLGPSEAIRFD